MYQSYLIVLYNLVAKDLQLIYNIWYNSLSNMNKKKKIMIMMMHVRFEPFGMQCRDAVC